MFSKENDRKIKITLIKSIIWIITSFVCVYLIIDINADERGFTQKQDVQFSHKIHSGKFQMKCLFCHYSAANSTHSNIPTTYDCIVCHIALKNEKPSLKPVIDSYYNKTALAWKRINQLPDHTHFDHSKHLKAEIDCSTCHGKVEEMDSIYVVNNFTMKWCVDCHNNPEKVIVNARDISGILSENKGIDSSKMKYSTIPFFGGYSFENKKQNSLANTNCTICHH